MEKANRCIEPICGAGAGEVARSFLLELAQMCHPTFLSIAFSSGNMGLPIDFVGMKILRIKPIYKSVISPRVEGQGI
jgi:hypothetical protein